jgi:hypothetical protein
MLLGAALAGVLVDRFLSAHATWPMHVLIIIAILGGGILLLSALSAVGRREARPGVSNEDLMSKMELLEAKVDGKVTGSTGPSYVASSVGATGAAGPAAGTDRTRYEVQASATMTVIGHAHGTVTPPSRWSRFWTFMSIDRRRKTN